MTTAAVAALLSQIQAALRLSRREAGKHLG